jgi:DNA-binding NtrC family response regulator
MATIRVAESKDWTEALTAVLSSAGHEVVADGTADVSFVDAAEPAHFDGAAIIFAAPLDQLGNAIERVKAGEAYAFIRYPFVADEVAILVDRTLDHVRLAQENQQLREQHGGEPAAPAATSTSSNADGVNVARNLAGKPLADIEKQVILSTLEQFKGHRVRTATALGIGVRTLGMKLKRWREEGEPIAGRSTVNRSAMHAGAHAGD